MNHADGAPSELACVVLSLANEPGLVDAVRSVLGQQPRPEIVVVNSGGGGPADTLREAGLDVRVIDRAEPLLPGAVRNIGIDATDAPFVAFLAADCRAEPGWVTGRLEAHRAGARAVACVMTNPFPSSRVASAAYLRAHFSRMPDTPIRWRRLYGLSYDRRLFERFGGFREDLRLGEDTEFNARLTAEIPMVCSDEVRTAHRYPVRMSTLLKDQYTRGRQNSYFQTWGTLAMLRRILMHQPFAALAQAWRTSDTAERRRLLVAWPLVPLACGSFAAGALIQRGSNRRRRSGGRPPTKRRSRPRSRMRPPASMRPRRSRSSASRAAGRPSR